MKYTLIVVVKGRVETLMMKKSASISVTEDASAVQDMLGMMKDIAWKKKLVKTVSTQS